MKRYEASFGYQSSHSIPVGGGICTKAGLPTAIKRQRRRGIICELLVVFLAAGGSTSRRALGSVPFRWRHGRREQRPLHSSAFMRKVGSAASQRKVHRRQTAETVKRHLSVTTKCRWKTPVTRRFVFNELISEFNGGVRWLCFASAQRSARLITGDSARITAASRRWWMIKRSPKN